MADFLEELREVNDERSKEWSTGYGSLLTEILFRSNEFGGEAGELQNEVKKWARGILNMEGGMDEEDLTPLKEEIGDVLITLDRIASIFGITLEECTRDKFNKTSDKYGFSHSL